MNGRLALIMGTCAATLLACGVAPDSRSGGDARRSDAREIQPNVWVDDRVSATHGDHTDWKSFELPVSSSVTLVFWWDEPSVDTRVVVRDQHGRELHGAEHDGDNREDRFGPVELSDGLYFLQVQAVSGASVYTMRIETGPGANQGRPSF